MKAIEFMPLMAQVIDNFRYFTLMGFHCVISSNVNSEHCELTVFYEEDSQKDVILEHSTLHCYPHESNGTKWIEMYLNDIDRND